MQDQRSREIVTDLLRSSWLIEQARARVFDRWDLREASERARTKARLIERHLGEGKAPDAALVDPHAHWIMNLAGAAPGEEPLGQLFLCRLSDWVGAHAAAYLGDDGNRVNELGEQERAGLRFPDALPPAPPFEPVESPPLRAPGAPKFRFAILSDTHFGSRQGEAAVRAAIKDINSSGAELVVQLGDLTDSGNRDEFELARNVLAGVEPPLVTMMGNHDVYSYAEDRIAGRELYLETFGRNPDGVLIEHQGVKFGVLDSIEHAVSPFAPFDLLTGTFSEGVGGAIARGTLTPPQHDLLADLAGPGAGPAFIFLHHPVQPFTGFPPIVFGLRDEDSGRLHATCDSGNIWGVFSGHTHRNARTHAFDGVPTQEVAIPRDYPFGYALVDVTDGGYSYRFHQISDEALLREGYARTGSIQRRYALGSESERSFVWTA